MFEVHAATCSVQVVQGSGLITLAVWPAQVD